MPAVRRVRLPRAVELGAFVGDLVDQVGVADGQGPAETVGDLAVQAQRGVVASSGEEGRPQGIVDCGAALHQHQQFHLVLVIEAVQLAQAGLLLDFRPAPRTARTNFSTFSTRAW